MSRVGKVPIAVPSGVKVEFDDNLISVKGKLGDLSYSYPKELVEVVSKEDKIIVTALNDNKKARANWGLVRNLIRNMVIGVSEGFTVTLELNGVGYRASIQGKFLGLFVGYSHEVKYLIPSGISIQCPKPTNIVISGIDKQLVGHVASRIRKVRPPEPYKGKGIKYSDEKIYRKEGKKK